MNDWLTTITDQTLVAKLKTDTIVSGGAITSALTGDKINDYDLYFRTYETALAVANYYVGVFNATNPAREAPNGKTINPAVKEENRKNCKGSEEKRIIIYMKSAGVAAEGQEKYAYYESQPEADADTFISSLAVGDVDPEDAEAIEKAENLVETLKGKKASYRPVFLSENAISLSDRVQLVIRFYGEPSEIHENYDYAHCMCYYDYATDKLTLPQEALESILSRTLLYKGSLYPVASIFRLRKFIARGWRITAGQMLKILFQISQLDLTDNAVLKDQLLGVDQAYMHQLLRALENKDPSVKVDSTYLAKLIDEIFE